ncbi:protease complex subunit PrcB family protein [Clostridium sp.]|uniref:protease complex subunit PrcB family protein n=1 Tax=Clostridium sp. TaxID=1506 RepID=UPI002FCACC14
MKKKMLIVLAAALVISIPTYVGAMDRKMPKTQEPTKVERNQGITVNQLEINYIDESKAEEILGERYTSISQTKGYKVININNETYLYIGLGEKPTGGYGIEVTRLEDNEGILNVELNVISPKEGDMVTQVITYPHRILKLSFNPRQVNIKSNNTKDTFCEINLKP